MHIAFAADEAYARPLAVAVHSLASVSHGVDVRVNVLDAGLSPTSRRRVEAAARDLSMAWHEVHGGISGVSGDDRFPPATYARLLLGDVLPDAAGRVLYLDVDVLVRRSLVPLWEVPLRDAVVGACLDERIATFGERWTPFHDADGIPAGTPYFNSGVLLVDLSRWRTERVGARALDLAKDRGAADAHDQGALNAVLVGQWVQLEPRWNQQTSIYHRRSWRDTPHSRRAFADAVVDPAIVHFTMAPKPWERGCRHPFAAAWSTAAARLGYASPERSWTASVSGRLRRSSVGVVGRSLLRRRGTA